VGDESLEKAVQEAKAANENKRLPTERCMSETTGSVGKRSAMHE